MTHHDLLAQLRSLEGVTGAALVGPDGALLTPPGEAGPFAEAAAALTAHLASERVLAELLGAEFATQTVLEFSAGTLLLTQAAEVGGDRLHAALLLSARDLNRVRAGLRRLLPAGPSAARPPQPRA